MNEVAIIQRLDRIIAGTLGQKSIATAAKYVKANKGNISKAMEEVEERMFSEDGEILPAPGMSEVKERKRNQSSVSDMIGAKVVTMPLRK